MSGVSTLIRFGDLRNRLDFDAPITIIMPVLDKSIGDKVNVYSSDSESIYDGSSPNWQFEKNVTVTDVFGSGVPYLYFTGDHASRWGVGTPTFDCLTIIDIPTIECEGLVALYNSTDGPHWNQRTNWLSGTLAENWYGIIVDPGSGTGVVTQIDLHKNKLSGTIPPEISNLSNLQMFSIYDNKITSLDPQIGSLSNLIILLANNNRLTDLPPEIGYLSNLQGLFVGGNHITDIS